MILVTGGSSGIGAAVVDELTRLGHDVLAPSRRELDVTQYMAWDDYVTDAVRSGKNITGLANCAGISDLNTLSEILPFEFDRTMKTNARSVLFGMQIVGEVMPPDSAIVNIASIFASHAGMGKAIAYQASKAAVLALSRNAAVHYAPKRIRVNTVIPGFVNTRMTKGKGYDDYALTAPMKRMLEPLEVAEVIVFLLSPAASGMTGAEVHVDGGWNAR